MKNIIIVILVSIIFVLLIAQIKGFTPTQRKIEQEPTVQEKFHISKAFEYEGYSIYRFYEGSGHDSYFTIPTKSK